MLALHGLAGGLVLIAVAGCGLGSSGSSTSRSSSPASSATVRGRMSPTTSSSELDEASAGARAHAAQPLTLVSVGPRGSASGVLYRYAVLYGNLCSCSQAPAKLSALAALAAPDLAAQLIQAATSARTAVAHGLPEPAQAVAKVENVELTPPKKGVQTGLVVLVEHTVIARRGITAPVPVVYTARLVNTPSGWRIASFTPVKPTQ